MLFIEIQPVTTPSSHTSTVYGGLLNTAIFTDTQTCDGKLRMIVLVSLMVLVRRLLVSLIFDFYTCYTLQLYTSAVIMVWCLLLMYGREKQGSNLSQEEYREKPTWSCHE